MKGEFVMKQLKSIVNCLQWNELNKAQQEKVLDKYRTSELDMLTAAGIIWDYTDAGMIIEDAGFISPEIIYSITNSQGDGACFDCTEFDYTKLLKDLDIPHKSWFIDLLNNSPDIFGVIERPYVSYAWHYCHERCRKFTINSAIDLDTVPRIANIIKRIQFHIEHIRESCCLKAEEKIADFIDYTQSDEFLSERFLEEETYFREDTLEIIYSADLIEVKEEKE